MFMLLPSALLLELFAHVCASPVNAAHPMITQRAELFGREAPSSFVGYYNTSDASGNTFLTSSENEDYVAIVHDSTLINWCLDDAKYLSTQCSSEYVTSCSGNTLYGASESISCPETCDYDVVYTGSTADSNSLRWYHCMNRPYLLFYREQPAGTLIQDPSTTGSSSTETPSMSSSSTNSSMASPASSGTTTVASQTSSPTNSPSPTPDPPKEKQASKAWIAGVVIGLVGLLAAAGMILYIWRQRQQKHVYGPAPQGPPQGQVQAGYPPQQVAHDPSPQQSHGNGPSPGLQPVSPNLSTHDTQSHYASSPKPQEGMMYGGYGVPPPGVGTVQMPQQSALMQPQLAASIHDLPELVPPSRR